MLINPVGRIKERVFAPYKGLKVNWFDRWHPVLDEAIQVLPEMESCPHELFRLLLQNPDSFLKKIALVSNQGKPVAIIPLRQVGKRFRNYEISTWIIPGALFPTEHEFLIPALEALQVEVWFSWRRMENLPSQSPLTRYIKETPVNILNCQGNYEEYWRNNGLINKIRKTRNRCKNFTVTVNSPSSAEWTIRNAAAKWRNDPERGSRALEDWAVSDWIVAAKYWEAKGKHFTIQLLDDGNPIGGATNLVHQNDLVGGLIYRSPEYNRYGIGTRLLDLCASFAAEHGYKTLDLGGDAGYKEAWAPKEANLYLFNLCPEPLFQAKRALSWLRSIKGK